jgi:hypothetical protein
VPDLSGAMTAADNEKLQRWWSEHWKTPVICPVCKTSEWIAAPHIVNIARHAPDANVNNSVSYPHVLVSCKTCAHSMFFNAVQIGVAPSYVSSQTESVSALASALSNRANPFSALASPSSIADLLKKDR